VATYLDEIVAAHRRRAARDSRPLALLEAAAASAPSPRPFAEAVRLGARAAGAPIAVIAEVKRRSPSKGLLKPDLNPARLAGAYADGGAACLSVLTDEAFFGGSSTDLVEARAAVELPVLRKDFTVSERDCYDARAMGADAVLLIVAVLGDAELAGLVALANRLGLDALVEVHDEAELDRALSAGATLVGVNQRDLRSFEVDRERALRVGAAIPKGVVRIAESGICDHEDLWRLADAGFDGALVGEALVTAADPKAALESLRGIEAGCQEKRRAGTSLPGQLSQLAGAP
jgi:indole-3-glycerol phosphate synthase